jgi:hypothetical protein
MLAYFISGSNVMTLRTQPTGSSRLTLMLENMYTLKNYSSSLTASYNAYESMLSFTASIPSAITGDEYRAYITNGTSSIWHGSIQVYASQSLVKEGTPNQIPIEEVFKSHLDDNQYIILT